MEPIIRLTEPTDAIYLEEWFKQDGTRIGFPALENDIERGEAVSMWIGLCSYKSSLTALVDGKPVGMVGLFLNTSRRISHKCELTICVDFNSRGKGIGSALVKECFMMAKRDFKLEAIHIWVSEFNRAVSFYERLGFKKIALHEKWAKFSDGTYMGRYLMEAEL